MIVLGQGFFIIVITGPEKPCGFSTGTTEFSNFPFQLM